MTAIDKDAILALDPAQLAAELAHLVPGVGEADRLRARIERGLQWCDLMDGPVRKSQFVNGQATAAQQIRAALGDTP